MNSTLDQLDELKRQSTRMPVLFLGHGSPMNALEENEFVQGFRNAAKSIQKPEAIIVISAHWETYGTKVTAMSHPKTIHDFGGFPKELYQIQYPAPGMPKLAEMIHNDNNSIALDHDWGLDHGAWTVIKHMYPDAEIPIVEVSLDRLKTPQEHYDLAKQLKKYREKGVLIIGSGNIIHNLRMIEWSKLNDFYAYDWAIEVDEKVKNFIHNHDHKSLINYKNLGSAFDLAIPTADHYLPLIYTLGMQDSKDDIKLFNDKPLGGSLSMTSIKLG